MKRTPGSQRAWAGWGAFTVCGGCPQRGTGRSGLPAAALQFSQQVCRDGLLAAVLQGGQLVQSGAKPLSRVVERQCEGGMR